jgi:DNA-binding transcriptional ArsR family regulator
MSGSHLLLQLLPLDIMSTAFPPLSFAGRRVLASFHDSTKGGPGYIDPRFRRTLWYLICSTKGGTNRARILAFINSKPANPNQIASELELDYKTVIHHLKVLSENGLVITDNKEAYGATYFLTPLMEKNYPVLDEIMAKIGTK